MRETGGTLGSDSDAASFMHFLEKRLEYEVFLEFGLESRWGGRTLEKSGSSTLGLDQSRLNPVMPRLLERLRNEVGELRHINDLDLRRIVAGWLYRFRINGAINIPPLYDEFIFSGANTYLISNSRIRWLPGTRKAPKFVAVNTQWSGSFDILRSGSWYDRWLTKHIEAQALSGPQFFCGCCPNYARGTTKSRHYHGSPRAKGGHASLGGTQPASAAD